jgi:hypothetical protein
LLVAASKWATIPPARRSPAQQGGASSQNANAKLERCDQSLGTLAVVEDQTAPWYYRLTREYKLTSTVPLIRLLVQQSNCFVVVERGRAFGQMQGERALQQTGELREGSNFDRAKSWLPITR